MARHVSHVHSPCGALTWQDTRYEGSEVQYGHEAQHLLLLSPPVNGSDQKTALFGQNELENLHYSVHFTHDGFISRSIYEILVNPRGD